MSELKFQQIQQQFCQAIRQADYAAMPQLQPERIQLYRELLFNNISSFVENVYPIAKSLLPQPLWQSLLDEFFAHAQCQSPLYHDISLHFREYVAQYQSDRIAPYPWLLELLQYEWLELYLDTLVLEHLRDVSSLNGDNWQLKTSAWVLVYQYPVYRWQVGMSIADCQVQPSAILVWRDVYDQIQVQQLTTIFALLIEPLTQGVTSSQPLRQLLVQQIPTWNTAQQQQQLDQLRAYLQQHDLL